MRGGEGILGHGLSGARSFPEVASAVHSSVSSRSPLPACGVAKPSFAVCDTGLRRHLIILMSSKPLLSTSSLVCCLFPSFVHFPVESSSILGANPVGHLLVCGSFLFIIALLDKQTSHLRLILNLLRFML